MSDPREGLGRKAYSAVRWTTVSMAGKAGSQFIQVVVLARLLNEADFGLMALVAAFVLLANLVTGMGLSQAIIHDQKMDGQTLSTLYWLNVLTGAGMTALAWFAAPGVAALYGEPRLTGLLREACWVFVMGAIGAQLLVRAEKELRFRGLAIVELTASALGLAVALTAAWWGWGVHALVAGLLCQVGARSLGAWIGLSGGWRPAWVFDLQAARQPVQYGLYVVGGALIGTWNAQLDVTWGGWWVGAATIGLYSLPRDLSTRVVSVTNPIVTRVGFPVLARLQDDPVEVRRVYLKAVSLIASVNVPIYAALGLYAEEVISLVLGERWLHAVPVFRLLTLRGMMHAVVNPGGSLVMAMGRADWLWKWGLANMVGILIIFSVGAQFGAVGLAASAALITTLKFVLQAVVLVNPLCGARMGDYWRALSPPFLSTAIAVSISAVATASMPGGPLRLVAGSLVGGAAYLAASWWLNRPWVEAMQRLTRRR